MTMTTKIEVECDVCCVSREALSEFGASAPPKGWTEFTVRKSEGMGSTPIIAVVHLCIECSQRPLDKIREHRLGSVIHV